MTEREAKEGTTSSAEIEKEAERWRKSENRREYEGSVPTVVGNQF